MVSAHTSGPGLYVRQDLQGEWPGEEQTLAVVEKPMLHHAAILDK